MKVKDIESKAAAIDNEYYRKISPLEKEKQQLDTWLGSKPKWVKIPRKVIAEAKAKAANLAAEIAKLKDEKVAKILALYREERMVAATLKELNELRGGYFKTEESVASTNTTREAYSKKLSEGAYFCNHCKLWIVGSPRRGPLAEDIYEPAYYDFCRICGNMVGEVTMLARRMFERHRP